MKRLRTEEWLDLLPADPRPWILESGEPWARYVALTELLDHEAADEAVLAAKAATLAHPAVRGLIARLPNWERETVISGHNSSSFAPNLLGLLADMGLGAGDDPRIEGILDQMLAHQEPEGRFLSLGRWRNQESPRWGALLCDTHAITESLVRFSRAHDPRVRRACLAMAGDAALTAQGRGWPCIPDPTTGFRGPGRKGDVCPQVTLEALRVYARLPSSMRPVDGLAAARTCLRAWRERGTEKPYMFGHGRQFKTVKWPAFWYDVYGVLDTLSRFPSLWKGKGARDEDRSALAEMAACLVAYNTGADGRVTPRSCYKGYEGYSFGQKKTASAYATARVCVPLRKLSALTAQIREVDVHRLGSSKGGSGTPVPPGRTPPVPPTRESSRGSPSPRA